MNKELNELEEYYSNQFEMLNSKGWEDFVFTANQIMKTECSLEACHSLEDFWKAKGKQDIIKWIVTWREQCETVYKQNFEQ